jgi:hypothetical protein
LIFLLLLAPGTAAARPWICLPPLFDGGQRLHALPAPRIYWLELLLRQHELCWRRPRAPDEKRIAVIGSSAVYGFPLPAEQTFSGVLNRHLAARDPPAHVFNLAFVNPYQVRDAVVIDAITDYDPDVIVYPMTLAEFRHQAPMPFPSVDRFFLLNRGAVTTLAANPPGGLEEAFANYDRWLREHAARYSPADQLRELGLFARMISRETAQSISAWLNAPTPPFQPKVDQRQTVYDCATTEWNVASNFGDWKQWNILAYLESVHRTRGIAVLVVHWPISHDPIDVCYSVRYTNAAVADFVAWLRQETARRGLAYLDLHDFVPNELFIDSVHLRAEGHARVGDAIGQKLDAMLQ